MPWLETRKPLTENGHTLPRYLQGNTRAGRGQIAHTACTGHRAPASSAFRSRCTFPTFITKRGSTRCSKTRNAHGTLGLVRPQRLETGFQTLVRALGLPSPRSGCSLSPGRKTARWRSTYLAARDVAGMLQSRAPHPLWACQGRRCSGVEPRPATAFGS